MFHHRVLFCSMLQARREREIMRKGEKGGTRAGREGGKNPVVRAQGRAFCVRGSIVAGQIALVGAAFTEQTRAVRRAGRFACATALTRGRSLVGAAFTDQTRAVVESRAPWGFWAGRGEGKRDGAVYSKQIRKSERNLTRHLRTTHRPRTHIYTHRHRPTPTQTQRQTRTQRDVA